jgi:hypothetical protein
MFDSVTEGSGVRDRQRSTVYKTPRFHPHERLRKVLDEYERVTRVTLKRHNVDKLHNVCFIRRCPGAACRPQDIVPTHKGINDYTLFWIDCVLVIMGLDVFFHRLVIVSECE